MLKKIAGWSWKKKIIGIICMMLILVLGMAGAVFGYAASKVNKIQKIEVKKETLKESITEEVEHKSGYLNVAVFGLDSRDGSLDKGNRSDTIMIVSLNQETYEVKMVSVYRDTFMRLKDGSYNKANAAYSYFGPDGGVALLNENMDMNIEKYVSVNFNALVDVIDAVGGMDLELTDAEVVHMNNYCVETSEVTGSRRNLSSGWSTGGFVCENSLYRWRRCAAYSASENRPSEYYAEAAADGSDDDQ